MNPPSNSRAFQKSLTMSESSKQAVVTSPFAEKLSSAGDRELRIDEETFARSLSLYLFSVPDFDVAVKEGKECVRQARNETVAEENAGNREGCAANRDY